MDGVLNAACDAVEPPMEFVIKDSLGDSDISDWEEAEWNGNPNGNLESQNIKVEVETDEEISKAEQVVEERKKKERKIKEKKDKKEKGKIVKKVKKGKKKEKDVKRKVKDKEREDSMKKQASVELYKAPWQKKKIVANTEEKENEGDIYESIFQFPTKSALVKVPDRGLKDRRGSNLTLNSDLSSISSVSSITRNQRVIDEHSGLFGYGYYHIYRSEYLSKIKAAREATLKRLKPYNVESSSHASLRSSRSSSLYNLSIGSTPDSKSLNIPDYYSLGDKGDQTPTLSSLQLEDETPDPYSNRAAESYEGDGLNIQTPNQRQGRTSEDWDSLSQRSNSPTRFSRLSSSASNYYSTSSLSRSESRIRKSSDNIELDYGRSDGGRSRRGSGNIELDYDRSRRGNRKDSTKSSEDLGYSSRARGTSDSCSDWDRDSTSADKTRSYSYRDLDEFRKTYQSAAR